MPNGNEDHWPEYHKPYRVFGPLLTIREIAEESRQAGFGYYNNRQRQTLRKIAEYAYTFLSQPHPDLGRDGSVCPFVPNALTKGLFRATVTEVANLETVEAALKDILTVFATMPPQSPPPGALAEGDQIYKAIIIGFSEVDADAAPMVIDELQLRLKPAFIRQGMMIGQFHSSCPGEGLHNPAFRPFQAPVACLAVRHITKYDAPFMDTDEFLDGYLRLFGIEGYRRLVAVTGKNAGRCPASSSPRVEGPSSQ